MKKQGLTPSKGWYFGWNIVMAASLLTMITVGMRMSIGPFVIPMSEGLGVTRSWLSGVVAIGMLFYGIGMPIAGYFVARRGTRFVLIIGAILVSISLLGTIYATNTWLFTFFYGILLSMGLAFTSPVAFTQLISRWFIKRRAMALLFLSTGSMAGIAIMTPLFTAMIKQVGWENTMLGYAAVFAGLTLLVAFTVVRENPPKHADLYGADIPQVVTNESIKAQTPPALSFSEVLKTRPFWQICAGVFACGFSMNLLGTHAVPMLVDHGFSKEVSSFGISLIGFVAMFSTVMIGRIASRVEHRYILMMIYLVRGIAFLCLVSVMTPLQLYIVTIIGGLVWAGNMGLSSSMLADLYGAKMVGMLYGWAFLGHQIGATLSTWLGGWGYERYGTHWIAFGAAGALLILASMISVRLPKRTDYRTAVIGKK